MTPITEIALTWARRCFGLEHVADRRVRALRLAEEVVELCQADGIPQHKIDELVNIVYRRPQGDAYQELGGVLLTAMVYSAGIYNMDPDRVLLDELLRVLAKPAEHFTERNKDKLDLGLR